MPINSQLPLLGMVAAALVVAFLVALIATPVVKGLAFKMGYAVRCVNHCGSGHF